jgi:hypothetical protein
MSQIKISAGKVPGTVQELLVEEGSTVLDAMNLAAQQCGFTFTTKAYLQNGKEWVDVPFLNGKELCRKENKVIVEVFWKTRVSAGDSVLIVPKIKGNRKPLKR